MRISVIIPVYNSERYLRDCVRSITRQSHKDIEVLLVDDGSTDGSSALCDSLSAEDARVVTIHKKNGGTSSARNLGMSRATGDYLTFCDNDDFLRDDNCIARVVESLSQRPVDVLMHVNCMYDDRTSTIFPPKETHLAGAISKMDKSDAILRIVSEGLMTRAVWNKVVRTNLVRDFDIEFPEGMRSEDTDWSAGVLECAKTVGWSDDPFYCYRKGHDSAQTAKPVTRSQTDDLAAIISKHIKQIDSLGLYGKEEEAILSYLAYPFIVWMGQASSMGQCQKDDQASLQMYSYARRIFAADEDPAVAMAAKAYRVLGFWGTARLLGFAFKMKQAKTKRHQ